MSGQVHLYSGDGKGKTSAAVGLALRAKGHGFRVWFVQFLKSGQSSELKRMETLGIHVISGQSIDKFSIAMSAEEKEAVRKENNERLAYVRNMADAGEIDLLVLDEAIGTAFGAGLLDVDQLMDFVEHKPEALELVLTGRDPSKKLADLVDYHSEIRMVRHPYVTKGLTSRPGIEY
ncbi:MAG TPA: cob(I)yrinic acid a,c-diamide adenosyltransferase [Fastidiosipila sp.]|nr:cob(I)yrinic acid a,c-diamide adenosyltransferase [Fastidiosipila sp.]